MKSLIIVAVAMQVAMVFCQDAKYIGCYMDLQGGVRDLPLIAYKNDNNKAQTCMTACKLKGYKYAGLQFTNECWCGNSFGSQGKADETDCDMNCPAEDTQICGSGNRNSVYSTGYLGCHKDSITRAMSASHNDNLPNNSIENCIAFCKADDFMYAGMENRTECFCDNKHELYGITIEGDCDMECPGNSNQKCGGDMKLSVYATADP